MKVALVHDWLTGMRGGERVLERLCRLFPGAPIHTLLWRRGALSAEIESHPVVTSFVQRLPFTARHYRWYLPLFPRAIESFDLSAYDAVISTSHAVAKSARGGPAAFHLSYIYTPMRYVWDLEQDYFPPGRFVWPLSWYVRRTCAALRRWDAATAGRAQVMVACSRHVAGRIRRCYGREADVIYPPVELERFRAAAGPRDCYLLAGAFAPYKRAELAIEACRRLGRRLLVAGSGPAEKRLRRLAGRGVEFLGWVSDAEMAKLYEGARALLFPGEEDFGMVPVEALASGCPVVACARGGALETVGQGVPPEEIERVMRGGIAMAPAGVLFAPQTADALCEAIRALEERSFEPAPLRALAAPFAAAEFDRRFMAVFERGWAAHRAAHGS
jgi:glycosyltransferase involved in cell wall biosynthesis